MKLRTYNQPGYMPDWLKAEIDAERRRDLHAAIDRIAYWAAILGVVAMGLWFIPQSIEKAYFDAAQAQEWKQ